MATIVQINYIQDARADAPSAAALAESATRIATVDGLLWKVWMHADNRRERGGVYLFDSAEAAQAYIDGPIVAALRANPLNYDLSVKRFDVRTEPSEITRAPLGLAAALATAAD